MQNPPPQQPLQIPVVPSRDRERLEKGNPGGPITPPKPNK
jgi:hypothetical protein